MLSIKNSSMAMISVSEDYLVNITYANIKTQDKQNKTTKTICVGHHYAQNNVKFLRYMAYVSVLYRNIWSHS